MLFLYGFGNAAAYVLARTIADSTFLSHIGPEHLPAMYMVSAGVVALSSIVFARLSRHTAPHRAVKWTLVVFAVTSALLPELMHRFASSLTAFAVVYLLTQIRGTLGTIQYATLLNEHFSRERPERVVGLAGAGATLAGFSLGMGIGAIPNDIDVPSLMYLTAAIDLLTTIPVARLTRQMRQEPSIDATNLSAETTLHVEQEGPIRNAIHDSYIRVIAGVVMIGVIVATLVEFQWKASVADLLNRDEAKLAEYFGFFYGFVYLATGGVQLFITGRLLERRSVLAGLVVFPASLLVTGTGILLASVEQILLWPVTLAKGCDIFKRSMNDPAIQVLYGPLESGSRRQAITFVAGIAKPLAEAVAAVLLLGLSRWVTVRQLSVLVVVLVLVWLMTSFQLWKRFTKLVKRNNRAN
jgi:ATP/ADP translocase